MLHIKPYGHWFLRRFLKGFYHIWTWQPSWLSDLYPTNKLSFPWPTKASCAVWLQSAQWLVWKCWHMTERQWTIGHMIGSPLAHKVSLKAQVSEREIASSYIKERNKRIKMALYTSPEYQISDLWGGNIFYPMAVIWTSPLNTSIEVLQVNWHYGSRKEFQNRFTRWQPFFISNRNDFSYFYFTSHPVLPIKFRVNWPFCAGERVQNRLLR